MNKKTKKPVDAVVAIALRATGSGADATSTETANITAPRARSAQATHETRATRDARAKHEKGAAGRTQSEALKDYWRDVKSGKRTRNEKPAELPKDPNRNPLFDLSEIERNRLYIILRDSPLMESTQMLLEERGIHGVTREQVDEFRAEESVHYWEVRSGNAAIEANALVSHVKKSGVNFSEGILAALGQETFKQITNGADPASMTRFANMFIKVRSDSRADESQGFKRRRAESDLGDGMHAAFRKLAEEVDRCPAAQEHFDALQRALAESAEEGE